MAITVSFRKDFALEKAISVLAALAVVVPLPPQHASLFMAVAGLGHFALAHIYQIKKKSPSPSVLILYFIALGLCLALSHAYTLPFVIALTCFFMFHCLWDEYKLLGVQPDPVSSAFVAMAVINLTIWMIGDLYALNIQTLVSTFIALSGSAFCLYAGHRALKHKLHINTNLFLFGAAYLCFVYAHHQQMLPDSFTVFRAFIIFHGTSWYIHLGRRYRRESRENFSLYVRDVLIVNAVIIAGFTAVALWPQQLHVLKILAFSSSAYYAWAMMHLFSTFRPDDYWHLWNVKARPA